MENIASYEELKEILKNKPGSLYLRRPGGITERIPNLTIPLDFIPPISENHSFPVYEFAGITTSNGNIHAEFPELKLLRGFDEDTTAGTIRVSRLTSPGSVDPYIDIGVLKQASVGGRRLRSKRRSRKQKLKRKTQRKRR